MTERAPSSPRHRPGHALALAHRHPTHRKAPLSSVFPTGKGRAAPRWRAKILQGIFPFPSDGHRFFPEPKPFRTSCQKPHTKSDTRKAIRTCGRFEDDRRPCDGGSPGRLRPPITMHKPRWYGRPLPKNINTGSYTLCGTGYCIIASINLGLVRNIYS